MRSAYNLRTGSKVTLNHDVTTEDGRLYFKGMSGIVDAVFRKDGVERIYVVFDGPVIVFHGAEVLDDADKQ